MRGSHFYDVHPRYTPGSPAAFFEDRATPERVAREERDGYERAMTGVYGETQRALAEKAGLHGIVESCMSVSDRIDVLDLLTDRRSTITTQPLRVFVRGRKTTLSCPTCAQEHRFRHLKREGEP